MSLGNFVEESANAPGTGTSVVLTGAPVGRVPFSILGAGATPFYFITDGTQIEAQQGALTLGPSVLARGTPIWTSQHGNVGTSRLNFTSAVRVLCGLPAEMAVWSGDPAAHSKLAMAEQRLAGYPVTITAQSVVDVTIPADAARLRLDLSGLVTSGNFIGARFNLGGGFLAGGSDYARAGLFANGATPQSYSTNGNAIIITNPADGGDNVWSEIDVHPGSTGRAPSLRARGHYVNAASQLETMEARGLVVSATGRATAIRLAALNAGSLTGRLMVYIARA